MSDTTIVENAGERFIGEDVLLNYIVPTNEVPKSFQIFVFVYVGCTLLYIFSLLCDFRCYSIDKKEKNATEQYSGSSNNDQPTSTTTGVVTSGQPQHQNSNNINNDESNCNEEPQTSATTTNSQPNNRGQMSNDKEKNDNYFDDDNNDDQSNYDFQTNEYQLNNDYIKTAEERYDYNKQQQQHQNLQPACNNLSGEKQSQGMNQVYKENAIGLRIDHSGETQKAAENTVVNRSNLNNHSSMYEDIQQPSTTTETTITSFSCSQERQQIEDEPSEAVVQSSESAATSLENNDNESKVYEQKVVTEKVREVSLGNVPLNNQNQSSHEPEVTSITAQHHYMMTAGNQNEFTTNQISRPGPGSQIAYGPGHVIGTTPSHGPNAGSVPDGMNSVVNSKQRIAMSATGARRSITRDSKWKEKVVARRTRSIRSVIERAKEVDRESIASRSVISAPIGSSQIMKGMSDAASCILDESVCKESASRRRRDIMYGEYGESASAYDDEVRRRRELINSEQRSMRMFSSECARNSSSGVRYGGSRNNTLISRSKNMHRPRLNTDKTNSFNPSGASARGPGSNADKMSESHGNGFYWFDQISRAPSQRFGIAEGAEPDVIQKETFAVSAPKPSWISTTTYGWFEPFVEIAEPEYEMTQIMRIAIPTTLAAISDPLFRVILAAIISHNIDTDSMIAYLFVILFLRMTTEELSEAISQAQSAMNREAPTSMMAENDDANNKDGCYIVGQLIQLSIILHFFLGGSLLAIWAFYIGDVVFWLVESQNIANKAQEYTQVILVQYLINALSKAFMLVFENFGHEPFETVVDIVAAVVTIATVSIVVSVKNADLQIVAYIQVLITGAATVTKLAYVVLKGWLENYRSGLLENFALRNIHAFRSLFVGTLAFFIGSFIEIGEVDVLTLFVHFLGPAEVSTWALLGVIWKILEAFTEGLGEAASIRVALLLSHCQPLLAKRLSKKILYYSLISSTLITCFIYTTGSLICVVLTTDSTMQNMFNNLILFVGLANISMGFSQASWSLVEAQGRVNQNFYIVIARRWFLTIPLALGFIFGNRWSLSSIGGALCLGHATASCIYANAVLRSDWEMIARMMQEPQIPFGAGNAAVPDYTTSEDFDHVVATKGLHNGQIVVDDDFLDSDSDDSDGFEIL